MKSPKLKNYCLKFINLAPLLIAGLFVFVSIMATSTSQNIAACSNLSDCSTSSLRLDANSANGCGSLQGHVITSINFGCYGNSCTNSSGPGYCASYHNGIEDLIFAVIRFLSDGVGLIIIVSVIIGGIQYILSRGDPNATAKAVNRLVSTVVALIIFIFAYAILNYVIPAGFFK
jgi:hypothetical protein